MYKYVYHSIRTGQPITFYKKTKYEGLTTDEEIQLLKEERKPITYDECLDITGKDKGDEIMEKTGVHPSTMFRRTLLEHGYTNEEINQIQPYPIEEIKPIKNNSIYKKKAPYGINHTYKLKYVDPIKYKNVLRKNGVDVDNIPYWNNIKRGGKI